MQLQSNFSLLFALGIAFYSSWQLTLVVLGITPGMMLAGAAKMKFMKGERGTRWHSSAVVAG